MILTLAEVVEKNDFTQFSKIENFVPGRDLFLRIFFNVLLAYTMLIASENNAMLMYVFWFIYATQFHFWGFAGIGHELLHGRVFTSRKTNELLYKLCSAITWNNASMFKDSHFRHHRDTFSIDDEEARSVRGWGILDFLFYFTVDLRSLTRRVTYTVINSFGFYPDLRRLEERHKNSARFTLVINILIYYFCYVLTENISFIILLVITPFSFTLLNKVLAKAQHHQLEIFKNGSALEHSRTLQLPIIFSFLYANMNYHAEHHFAPSIPYYNLPRFHDHLVARGLIHPQKFTTYLANIISEHWSRND